MMSTSQAPMCPEASKFRIAPLHDEEDPKILFDKNVVTNSQATVPPTSQVELLRLGSTLMTMLKIRNVKVKRTLLLRMCVHMARRRDHASTHLLPRPHQR